MQCVQGVGICGMSHLLCGLCIEIMPCELGQEATWENKLLVSGEDL